MTLTALAMVVLTQAEPRAPVGVVLTSHRPNTEAFSPKIAARVVEALKREGVEKVLDDAKTVKDLKAAGVSDPRSCNGGASCTAKLAVLLGPKAIVVGIDVGKVGKSLAIHLEAFAADAPEPLAVSDLSAREDKWADQTLAEVTAFARAVKLKVTPAAPRVVSAIEPERPKDPAPPSRAPDAPVSRPLEPTDDPSDLREPSVSTAAPSRVPAIVVASAAGAAGIAATIFGLLALGGRNTWNQNVTTQSDGTLGTMTLTFAEVNALRASVNRNATFALTGALLSAGLGGLATWLFLKDAQTAAR